MSPRTCASLARGDSVGPNESTLASYRDEIKARVDYYDLECTTVVRADDRERLEHLCKYVLRPPLADRRLRLLSTGEVGLELKSAWRDGTKWLTFEPDTFLDGSARSCRRSASTPCSTEACSPATASSARRWCREKKVSLARRIPRGAR